jgi:hypothetical protein
MKLTNHLQIVPRSRKRRLYIHSPIRLHGVVLNELSKETSLPIDSIEERNKMVMNAEGEVQKEAILACV